MNTNRKSCLASRSVTSACCSDDRKCMKSILAPTDSGVQRHSCYLHIRSCFSLLLRKRVFGEWVTRDFYCPDAVPVTQATVTKALDETQSTDTSQESSSTGSLRRAFFIHSRRIPGGKGRRSFTPALRHCNLPPCLERLLVLYVVSPRRSDVFELAAQSECTTICAALLTHERTRMTTGVRRMGQMELR